MRQKLISALLCALLILALPGCGSDNTSPEDRFPGQDTMERTMDGVRDAGDDMLDAGRELLDGEDDNNPPPDAGDNTFGGGDAASEEAEEGGRPAEDDSKDSTSFEHMMENGRVHDSDGDLTDGENAAW